MYFFSNVLLTVCIFWGQICINYLKYYLTRPLNAIVDSTNKIVEPGV